MFSEIIKDVKYQIRIGGPWVRIILLCAAVFFIVNIIKSYFIFSQQGLNTNDYQTILKYIVLSSSIWHNFIFPWVWITHLFVHEGLFHFIWNMVALYWFGLIVEDFIGRRAALIIFFEGGIVGGIFFLLSCQVIPWYQNQGSHITAYGASAGIMALLFAAAKISPNYNIRLLLIGNVPIKYLALVLLVLDLLFMSQENTGGHIAHIGGALFGYLYIFLLRKGISLDPGKLFVPKLNSPKKSKYQQKKQQTKKAPIVANDNKEERLNQILEKIKREGIEVLTAEEKLFLEEMSKH